MSPSSTRSKSLHPSGASGTSLIRSRTPKRFPRSTSWRNQAGPRKYPWASCSISRVLNFFPLTAETKASTSAFRTPFRRMNERSVYMYE